MHIVIIEDEAAVAETLAEAVRGQGHTTSVRRTSKEGLALLSEHTPDAVFLDLVMPGLSGVELLREIRRDKPELPIVVVRGGLAPSNWTKRGGSGSRISSRNPGPSSTWTRHSGISERRKRGLAWTRRNGPPSRRTRTSSARSKPEAGAG